VARHFEPAIELLPQINTDDGFRVNDKKGMKDPGFSLRTLDP
jgi:hypothetical protein